MLYVKDYGQNKQDHFPKVGDNLCQQKVGIEPQNVVKEQGRNYTETGKK
jgi:hypothetical protein